MPRSRSSALTPTAQQALDSAKGILLDIGCGEYKHPGAFGLDFRPMEGVDLVWDLTKTPWPLPDNCAHTMVMSHVWEHIPPWLTLAVMQEIHRVGRHKAGLFVSGPYGMGHRFQQDPTHCNPTVEATWAYWCPEDPSGLWQIYKPSPFHKQHFTVIPAGDDRDFNAVLSVCKDPKCKMCVPFRVAMADGSALAAVLAPPNGHPTTPRKRGSRG